MHRELTKHGKYWMQNNQLRTKSPVESKDDLCYIDNIHKFYWLGHVWAGMWRRVSYYNVLCYYKNNDFFIPVAAHTHREVCKVQVIEFEDRFLVPLPPPDPLRNYTAAASRGGVDRSDIKPLHIVQPEGPSFRVNGYAVEWQKVSHSFSSWGTRVYIGYIC
jgi:hypothetical protein